MLWNLMGENLCFPKQAESQKGKSCKLRPPVLLSLQSSSWLDSFTGTNYCFLGAVMGLLCKGSDPGQSPPATTLLYKTSPRALTPGKFFSCQGH